MFSSNFQSDDLLAPQGKRVAKSSSKPRSREVVTGYTCSLYQDHLYLFGGWHQRDGYSKHQIYIYRLTDNRWVKGGADVKYPDRQARFGHTASVYKNQIIFYGGKENPRAISCLRTTNILALDPKHPHRSTWLPSQEIQDGPVDCITHLSHIYDDKMYIFQQNFHKGLFYLDLETQTWSDNLLQGTSTGERIWVFSGSKLFGLPKDVFSIKTKSIQMIDLTSPGGFHQINSGESAPCVFPSWINTELNGKIYILGSELPEENEDTEGECKLWSYDTGENTWKALEDSGSLVAMSYNQHTLTYKNKILAISTDLEQNDIEILHATLSEEDIGQQPIKNLREVCREKPESFIKDVKNLFAGMLFTDVVFEVEDQEIPAHRSILAYRSQYFMNLFTKTIDNKIKISDIKPHLFKAILQYIYCNEIELDEQLALELLPILDKYLLDNLRGLCEKYLAVQIRKDNVISMLITADNYKIQKLKEACFRFITKNLNNVCDSDEVMELSKSLFLELLKFQNSSSSNQSQEKKTEMKVDRTLDDLIGYEEMPKKKSRGRPKKEY